MAKPKRYRWVCPSCGKGALGNSRPKRLATVRFCLPCSAKSTELVARTCPTLEKSRTTKTQRATAKRASKAQREKATERARWCYAQGPHVYDLRREAKKLWKAMGMRNSPPAMKVRLRREDRYTTGRSYKGRIVLTLFPGCSAGEAVALLAHELAHEAAPYREGHGGRWRSIFACSVEGVYGADSGPLNGDSLHDLHGGIVLSLEKILGE